MYDSFIAEVFVYRHRQCVRVYCIVGVTKNDGLKKKSQGFPVV